MDGVRVQKNSFETSLFVVYLPKSMCKEIPDYYTSEVDGREVKRPRYAARDYEEAMMYPEESMRWLAENFIPGGIDAVAGGDMRECPIVCVRGLGLQVVRESVGVCRG